MELIELYTLKLKSAVFGLFRGCKYTPPVPTRQILYYCYIVIMTKRKRQNREEIEQVKIFDWARYPETLTTYPMLKWLVSSGNGLHISGQQRTMAVLGGMTAGVSDIQLLVPSAPFYGLLIELKKPDIVGKSKGKVSQEQKDYLNDHSKLGYCCRVTYSADETIQLIKDYLHGVDLGINPVY